MFADVEAVIFDFDYTLADSSPGVIECVNFAFGRLGLRPASPESIRKTIGTSLSKTLESLAGPEHAALSDEFFRLFVQRADEVMVESTTLFDRVPDAVRELKSLGLSLGIVSSKYRRRIEVTLGAADLLECFDVIVGGEDVQEIKPSPVGLRRAIERLGRSVDAALYVGDSTTDAETAMRARVRFVAVLSGVTPKEEFVPFPVEAVLADVSELPQCLAR
ncbi:MAG: HAD-IA family hydrolase [Chloroflexi bacterium]|nr:HAD-IA family hydrolase [Chloroflexota bacterium]